MNRHELIRINPLRLIAPADGSLVRGRHLAVIKAAPGTGKTAILVQIALDKLLAGKRLVHVGIDEHLPHIRFWYSQVLNGLAHRLGILAPEQLETDIMGHRLLMTFMSENFTPQRLAERLDGLARHQIAMPDCVIIDGRTAAITADEKMLSWLRNYAEQQEMTIWLACGEEGADMAERHADTLLELSTSAQGHTTLTVVKDVTGYAEAGASLSLDSQTMTLCR